MVKRENDSLSDLLAHLAELDQRQLCIALGYSSLFAYCTEALGFCKSSAGRRIAAARVCREFPEAFARVAQGELQLSVLCALRPHLNPENASELFAACSRKSFEQVEELLAVRFPKPDVRDLIRRLPERVSTPDIGSEAGSGESVEMKSELGTTDTSTAPTSTPLSQSQCGERKPAAERGSVKPLSADRFSVSFTADCEFRELLDEVRALISHSEPKGELMTLMKRGLEALRGELLKKRFGVGRKPRRVRSRTCAARAAVGGSEGSSARPAAVGGSGGSRAKPSRYVPAAAAREVYVRDEGCCTFCADDGRRCGERRWLQLDHVIPFAEGGVATVGNLRLRCRAHNLHAARVHFGAEQVQAAVERTRGARSDRAQARRSAGAAHSVPRGAT